MNKWVYTKESTKITVFCMSVILLLWLLGFNQRSILVAFNMAVMSAAATFIPQKKPITYLLHGSTAIVLSMLLGELIGFYLPHFANSISILYAAAAFYLPTCRTRLMIYTTSALMFMIFSFNPCNINTATHELFAGIIVIGLFLLFSYCIDNKIYPNTEASFSLPRDNRHITATIAVLSITCGFIIMQLLAKYTAIQHIFWLALTIMVIIQGSHAATIKTALLRIAVNTVGAIIVIALFSYSIPNIFWFNLLLLVILLFAIFALGYSYILRTLFIELFVLSFTHYLGQYHNVLAYDRILLTMIGGGIVIAVTLLIFAYEKCIVNNEAS